MLYRREPKIELLVKAGLHSLVCPSGLKALKGRRVRDWVMAHRGRIVSDEDVSVRDITLAVRRGVTLEVSRRAREIASEVRCRVDMREGTGAARLGATRGAAAEVGRGSGRVRAVPEVRTRGGA